MERFLRDEEGPTMVEYGLLVALIALVAIAVVREIGQIVIPFFDVF